MKAFHVLLAALTFMHYAQAEEPKIVADGSHSFIKIGANFALCGAITFTPKPGVDASKIRLESFLYSAENKYIDVLGSAILPQSGLTQEYQWAGWGDRHFRVYVYLMTENGEIWANPNDYVEISFRHNVPCVLPAFGGPNAPKEPLNLNLEGNPGSSFIPKPSGPKFRGILG